MGSLKSLKTNIEWIRQANRHMKIYAYGGTQLRERDSECIRLIEEQMNERRKEDLGIPLIEIKHSGNHN